MDEFTSGARRIRTEWFPAGAGEAGPDELRPGLLLLHGADGLAFGGDRYRLAAGLVSASGYHVGLVHYLDRTGERRVDYATLRENYPLWVATIGDAVGWLARRPGVDAGRLGLVGVSLGGALALSTAASDGRVRAVVEYSGPVPEDLPDPRPKLPPTLVLHGEADRIVPASHARRLQQILRESGTPHEVQVYPGQGHVLSGAAQFDAASRVASFLARHL
ncbi:prolyl oligopeptidase family serine peptidase [Enterovirga sp. DB1703]|uniref:Prolyl oligopeptidase family serine peptidase n=2 Tax=Enterovirga aerilata TaxID=2730920 RepID=A0A849IAJ8_9HYPH|nr:prolyl oligopeptidase family serine peptidase [Enterovirga sp. DB1703]